jgi:hypothetical protein
VTRLSHATSGRAQQSAAKGAGQVVENARFD